MKIIYTSLLLSLTFQLLKLLPLLLTKKTKVEVKSIDFRDLVIEWLFSFLLIACFFSLTLFFNTLSHIIMIFVGVAFASLLMSYNFFLYPFIILFRKRKYKRSIHFEKWAKSSIDKSINIRLLDVDITNAYATGVLSAAKVILLSKQLVDKLSERDIKNLIYHEYAHLKHHHLLIMYLSNVACCTLSVISASYFYPIFSLLHYTGLLVGLHGAFFGAVYMLIPGLVQRYLEYQADRYAALQVGVDSYVCTLTELNSITGGGLQKNSISYPKLLERIQYVSKI